MVLERVEWPDTDAVTRLAGVTGFGWTASILAYLSWLLGYGHTLLGRLAADPQSFLYVGVVLLLTTLGLDRLANLLPDG